MRFFTICSRNFLAQAITLYESISRHHPHAGFSVALCDEIGSLATNGFPFEVIALEDLQISALDQMIKQYNITELNTAIKPFVFDYLFQREPRAEVVYLDPDILVVSPLLELQEAFEQGADCILTPHMTEPCEWAEMNERQILQFGAYNLGFLGLRGTDEVVQVCRWWARRLETECVIDLEQGLFVDQKWAGLLPCFIECTTILRHPGYNVAYWNMSHRRVTNEDGHWSVNGKRLRFFHFSGSVVSEPTTFSRHSGFYVKNGLRDLDDLFADYCQTVQNNGLAYYQKRYPFSYNWNNPLGNNEHTPQAMVSGSEGGGTAFRIADPDATFPNLPLLRASSLQEFEKKSETIELIEGERRAIEDNLVPADDVFRIDGYCVVCGEPHSMTVSSMYSSGKFSDGRHSKLARTCELRKMRVHKSPSGDIAGSLPRTCTQCR